MPPWRPIKCHLVFFVKRTNKKTLKNKLTDDATKRHSYDVPTKLRLRTKMKAPTTIYSKENFCTLSPAKITAYTSSIGMYCGQILRVRDELAYPRKVYLKN